MAVIIPAQVIKISLNMTCQRIAVPLPFFYLFIYLCFLYLPVLRVSEASAHYEPISPHQLIFTFDSAAALMGVGNTGI